MLAFLLLFIVSKADAKVELMVVGGGGRPWGEVVEKWIALDDRALPGSIQPVEIRPGQNVLRSPEVGRELRNIFGYAWCTYKSKRQMEARGYELGWNPRIWVGGGEEATARAGLIDGDETRSAYRSTEEMWITLDMGIPVPVDSVSFFPPQHGMDAEGNLYKDLYPKGYEVSLALRPTGWLIFEAETDMQGKIAYHPLDEVIKETISNTESMVGIGFEPRFARFVRFYFGGVPQTFSIAELKVYGRGFPAVARYISKPISFPEPVNFGRVTWKFTKFRRTSEGVVPDPEAPVRLVLQTRTGLDNDPNVYHVYDELGRQQVVDKDTYERAPAARTGPHLLGIPGFRGPITEDTENWDPWSSPYKESGEEVRSSDARRYLQFKFVLETNDPFTFGRLDSLAFEYSPLLAEEVLGEVSLLDQPNPPGGVVKVPAGVDTLFAYDVRAEFGSSGQGGFDAVRLRVPLGIEFVRLEMGNPLVKVDYDSLSLDSAGVTVYFPSYRVTAEENRPLRLVFRTAVFQPSVYFTGEVLDTRGEDLPQSISPGDANPDVSSDGIQVLTSEESLSVLSNLEVVPDVLTPDGDGTNEVAETYFSVLGAREAFISVEVYDLSGGLVKELFSGCLEAGRHVEPWDGRDEEGDLVPPGLYLVRVRVEVDAGTFQRIGTVSVLY